VEQELNYEWTIRGTGGDGEKETITVKSTEVQTLSMLVSGAQLPSEDFMVS